MNRRHVVILMVVAIAAVALAGCSKKSSPTRPPTTGGGEAFDSGVFSSGSSPSVFVHTFTTEGTWEYYCSIHGSPGSGMSGTIHVATGMPESTEVNVADNQFIPNAAHVRPGGYVKWFATGGNHTVTR